MKRSKNITDSRKRQIQISYVYCSVPGLVRKNHEDNYLAGGENLDSQNHGSGRICYGSLQTGADMLPVFAVFDGMGGEARGEMAAYLASEEMKAFCRDLSARDRGDAADNKAGSSAGLHLQLCNRMNRRVLSYAKEKHVRAMGTTVAYMMPVQELYRQYQ